MVEQIVMSALWKQFDLLRVIRGAIYPQAHFHRDHRVLLTVQDENRDRIRGDAIQRRAGIEGFSCPSGLTLFRSAHVWYVFP